MLLSSNLLAAKRTGTFDLVPVAETVSTEGVAAAFQESGISNFLQADATIHLITIIKEYNYT